MLLAISFPQWCCFLLRSVSKRYFLNLAESHRIYEQRYYGGADYGQDYHEHTKLPESVRYNLD